MAKRLRIRRERTSFSPAGAALTGPAGRALSSGGRPLDAAGRSAMEPRFGHDFSKVRIHTGDAADSSARALGARAWTLGSDIVFAAGEYVPGTPAGRRLLAHELAHTVQQAGAGPAGTPAVPGISRPGDESERAAATAAAHVARADGALPPGLLAGVPAPLIQREEAATTATPAVTPTSTSSAATTAAAGDAKDSKATTRKLSGASWYDEFPTKTEISDLDSGFGSKVTSFKTALETAGATTAIEATKRPAERAYLMHYAWRIVKEGFDASKAPAKDGVNIEWWHGDAAKSKAAAQEMVDKYKINNLEVAPALNSRHVEGKAIDMSVSWTGTLKLTLPDGAVKEITSDPKDHTNADLIAAAKLWGVVHFTNVSKDKVHWSTDGH